MRQRTERSLIEIKSRAEIKIMQQAGAILRSVLNEVVQAIDEGVATKELDALACRLIKENQCEPAFLGYRGYPATVCISINEEVVHGIPSDRKLRVGDIVSLDLGLYRDGFFADKALTVAVGQIDAVASKLLEVTEKSLYLGIEQARDTNRLGDLSNAVQEYVEAHGFSVVREYSGHGIGRAIHEPPQIPNFGNQGTGPRLRPGMALAIEPMVNEGGWKTIVKEDGWTVITADGKRSAHFEHTIAVTDGEALILT